MVYSRKNIVLSVSGSCDAGQNIRVDTGVLTQKMKKAAKMLNIKGHEIQSKTLYTAVDVEIHKNKVLKYTIFEAKNRPI